MYPIVTASSGNVFADLGFAGAEERKTKVRLAFAINQILQRRHLPQAEAARRLAINQPRVSALVNYRLEGFSVERLMYFLNALSAPPSGCPARFHVGAQYGVNSRLIASLPT
jgi:predicted XRE-type DNA-binding protein